MAKYSIRCTCRIDMYITMQVMYKTRSMTSIMITIYIVKLKHCEIKACRNIIFVQLMQACNSSSIISIHSVQVNSCRNSIYNSSLVPRPDAVSGLGTRLIQLMQACMTHAGTVYNSCKHACRTGQLMQGEYVQLMQACMQHRSTHAA